MNARITPSPRTSLVRAGIFALATLTVFAIALPAAAQARGPLVILGLRAPDGDDDAASNATTALRRAARAAGYEVPNDSPALEQSMAAFGCDDSLPPECLQQIANDLHATRMVYGAVRRHGRGRDVPLTIQVSLYDGAAHAATTHGEADVARAIAQDMDSLNPTTRRLVTTLLPAPAAEAVVAPANTSSAQPTPHPAAATSSSPTPIRRYVGLAAIAVGAVGVIVGVAFGAMWLDLNAKSQQPGSFWLQYRPIPTTLGATDAANPNNDTSAVCTYAHAHNDANSGMVATTCDQSSSLQTTEIGLLVAGGVLLVGGLVLFMTDNTGHETPAEHHARLNRPRFNFAPAISPTYQGAALQVTF